jgi:hypothetical protein
MPRMTDLAKKLRIKEGDVLVTVNAPADFRATLGPLPAGVRIARKADKLNQVHWFVADRAHMEKELNKVLGLLKPGVTVWIYYPKGSSKMQTDLSRDKGWDALLRHQELQWISMISFDETWSTFALRLQTTKDKARAAQPNERPILAYIDAVAKTVRLPDDFAQELEKNKQVQAFFSGLSFTNRKEYVEWIVSAKRPETRAARIAGSIERLGKGWKNPRNNIIRA